jgi:hypothetical protein
MYTRPAAFGGCMQDAPDGFAQFYDLKKNA